MPPCCSVPMCSNRGSGHSFPKDKILLQKWLKAIRRLNFEPTQHSRVCKSHFKEDDFVMPVDSVLSDPKPRLRKDAVPSIFAWTKCCHGSMLMRDVRVNKRKMLASFAPEEPMEHLDHATSPLVDGEHCHQENSPEHIMAANLCSIDITVDEGSWLVTAPEHPSSSVNHSSVKQMQQTETSANRVKFFCDNNSESEESNLSSDSQCSETSEPLMHGSESNHRYFCIKNLVTRPKELFFYTGMENYGQYITVLNILGDDLKTLQYPNVKLKPKRALKSEDELFLTLIKLRRNMSFEEIKYRFGVSKAVAFNIFVAWIDLLYRVFSEIDIWPNQEAVKNSNNLNCNENPFTVMLDCIEIGLKKPRSVGLQQHTFSASKRCNTVKVLVGISPKGAVTFVSKAYGGSLSDRDVFEKSGIVNFLESKDIIILERDFLILDLISRKKVTARLASFSYKDRIHVKEKQVADSKCVSSEQIHVKRVMDLCKRFKVLSSKLCTSDIQLAGKIIHVCLMLANFHSNIVRHL